MLLVTQLLWTFFFLTIPSSGSDVDRFIDVTHPSLSYRVDISTQLQSFQVSDITALTEVTSESSLLSIDS